MTICMTKSSIRKTLTFSTDGLKMFSPASNLFQRLSGHQNFCNVLRGVCVTCFEQKVASYSEENTYGYKVKVKLSLF
jgi:hypothetical protein